MTQPRDASCIFCKIAAGEIPCFRLHDDGTVLAFLDVGPLAEGHALIIPKAHYRDIRDVPEPVLADIVRQVPRLSRAVMAATNADGMNLLQNTGAVSGQAVFHLHFHLIPRREGDGLGYRWNAGKYESGRAEAIHSQILNELEG